MYFSSIGPIKKCDHKRLHRYTSDHYKVETLKSIKWLEYCYVPLPPPGGATTYFNVNIPYIIIRNKNISHLLKKAIY
jgi:hypothetical protein